MAIAAPVLAQVATLQAEYDAVVDANTALNRENIEYEADLAGLKAQLEATSVRAPLAERGLFVVDPLFSRDALPEDERVLYDGVWDHIEREFVNTILPIDAMTGPMHLKSMREV